MRPLIVIALVMMLACGVPPETGNRVLLVTTHSVEDSGLLEQITAAFREAHPELRLFTTAVGSGAALEMGRRGDADVLLTHDPDGEAAFMEAGYGLAQGPVMISRFLLVGPADDPAGVAGLGDVLVAFRRVAASEARFLSRGDDSGTHRKERALWRATGLEPWASRAPWYIEAGLGMAETLQTGTELGAYLVTDEATFRFLAAGLRLVPMVQSDPRLANPYAYTIVMRARNPEGARILATWLTGQGQAVIARHGADRFGQPLFHVTGHTVGASEPVDP